MNTMFLENAIKEGYQNGEISKDEAVRMMTFVNEASANKGGIKAYLKDLEEIKNMRPSEYDGPKAVKVFVDKYYDKIMKSAAILETEPEKLRKAEITALVGMLVSIIGGYALMAIAMGTGSIALMAASGPVMVIGCIASLVADVIIIIRANKDTVGINQLSKIKNALKRINLKKLDEKTARKITEMIHRIDDAEQEFASKVKGSVTKESVDEMRSKIYEAFYNDEITLEECNALLEKCEAKIEESADDNEETEINTDVMDRICEAYANDEITDEEYDELMTRFESTLMDAEEIEGETVEESTNTEDLIDAIAEAYANDEIDSDQYDALMEKVLNKSAE